MKILVASAAFYPENSPRSFRATELAKQFSRLGHQITVITVDRGEAAQNFCDQHNIQLRFLPSYFLKPITIYPKGILNFLSRAFNRLLLLLVEYPEIELMFKYRKALSHETGYDLLISVAVPYPVHWGVAWAWKRQLAKCWVADCGDPYMGATIDSFRKMFYFKYLEKWFSRKADFISITNSKMIHNYYPEFHPKIVEITQGFNFEETHALLPVYERNAIPTFAFAGTFIPGSRDPRALFQYLVGLETDFKFLIFSAQRSLIEPYLKEGRGRIEIRDLVPRHQLLQTLKKMDFLINISYDITVQSPSKLIDYYLVDRPVLSLQSGEVDELKINEFLTGRYDQKFQFEDYNKFRIENVCNQFLSLSKNELLER